MMAVTRGKSGSGMTESATLKWTEKTDEADPEIAQVIERGSLEGLFSQIERECFALMDAAGLPTFHGSYAYKPDGTWIDVCDCDGWPSGRIANVIWPIAEAKGYKQDDPVGFAARMLGDIVLSRRALEEGKAKSAALSAFYLGAKWSSRRMKIEHEPTWEFGNKTRRERQDGGAATRKGSDAERVKVYREFREMGLNKTDSTDLAAKKLRVSPATIRNARKEAGASD